MPERISSTKELHQRDVLDAVASNLADRLNLPNFSGFSSTTIDRTIANIFEASHHPIEIPKSAEPLEQIVLSLIAEHLNYHPKKIARLLYQEYNSPYPIGSVGIFLANIYPEVWLSQGLKCRSVSEFVTMNPTQKAEVEDQIINWFIANKRADEEHVYRLHLSLYNAKKIQDHVMELLMGPDDAYLDFNAITLLNHKIIIFCIDDLSGHDEIHERLHFDYPGLTLGVLGDQLDEAFTEHLTMMAEAENYNNDVYRQVIWAPRQRKPFGEPGDNHLNYQEARLMLAVIAGDLLSPIYFALLQRYQNDNLANSFNLITTLINRFGLMGYLSIYLASESPSKPLLSPSKVKDLLTKPIQI